VTRSAAATATAARSCAARCRRSAKEGRGIVLYLRQEGRGIGLLNKIRAYALQEQGADTLDATACWACRPTRRDYGVAAAMLAELGATTIRLMTNNPTKIESLQAHGITIAERVPLQVGRQIGATGPISDTKAHRMGHVFDVLREPSERIGDPPCPGEGGWTAHVTEIGFVDASAWTARRRTGCARCASRRTWPCRPRE